MRKRKNTKKENQDQSEEKPDIHRNRFSVHQLRQNKVNKTSTSEEKRPTTILFTRAAKTPQTPMTQTPELNLLKESRQPHKDQERNFNRSALEQPL
jgi:hypothetical protein